MGVQMQCGDSSIIMGVLVKSVKSDRKDEAMDYANASLGNDLAHDVVNKVAE
jgi:hypothetical protein